MRKQARWAMTLALGTSLGLAACDGAPEPSAAEPAARAAVAPAPSVSAAPSQPDTRGELIVGRWCLRSLTSSTGEVALDGSGWEFRSDGSFRYDGEVPVGGEWKLAGEVLELSKVGNYKVLEITKDHVALENLRTKHDYYRECGEEVERARKVASLCKAALEGDYVMVKALLDQGIDVNAVDRLDMSDRTPLLAAVQSGNLEVIKLLLARGADVTIPNAIDKTSFDLARTKPEIFALLVERLPQPASYDAPVLVAKTEQGECAAPYRSLHEVCVHPHGMPRPRLRAEIGAFTTGGLSPTLASYDPTDALEGAKAEAAPKSESSDDPTKVDPGALMKRSDADDDWGTPAPMTEEERREDARARQRLADELMTREEQRRFKKEYGGPGGQEKFERDFRKAYCEQGKKQLDAARRGQGLEMAEQLGFTRDEYIAQLEKNYREACQ